MKNKISPIHIKASTIPQPKVDYIIMDDSIRLKSREVLNFPEFTQKQRYIEIPTQFSSVYKYDIEYVPTVIDIMDVDIHAQIKKWKLKKIMALIKKQNSIQIVIVYKNGTRVLSRGVFKSITYSTGFDFEFNLIFAPWEYSTIYEP